MSNDDVALGPFVSSLLGDFELHDGRVFASPEMQSAWVEKIQNVAKSDRKQTCQELIACAIRFREMGSSSAAQGTDLLMALAAVLVGKDPALSATYDEGAARLARAKALGADEDLRPATERPAEPGAVKWSPLDRFALGKDLDEK